jgi:hypothetical protein
MKLTLWKMACAHWGRKNYHWVHGRSCELLLWVGTMSLVTPTVVDGFLYWSSGCQDPRGPTPPKPISDASFFPGGPVHSHEMSPGANSLETWGTPPTTNTVLREFERRHHHLRRRHHHLRRQHWRCLEASSLGCLLPAPSVALGSRWPAALPRAPRKVNRERDRERERQESKRESKNESVRGVEVQKASRGVREKE